MPELSVAIFATDNDQRAVLQVLVDGTSVARTVCSNADMPVAANGPVVRKTRGFAPDVILLDIAGDGIPPALRALELLHQEIPNAAIFAIGPMTQPQLIVSAMRAGVREYLERPTTTTDLLDAFMARPGNWLQVLAGAATPTAIEPSASDFARLFDTMVGLFHYIVVDASSRLDSATRLASNLSEKTLLVAHADVATLWSAGRVAQYLGESGSRERFSLILNRYRKVAGFNESGAEAAIGAPVLWRIPNQYFAVSTAIDRGVPLMQQGNTEISRSISGLAEYLTKDDLEIKRTAWSLFKTV